MNATLDAFRFNRDAILIATGPRPPEIIHNGEVVVFQNGERECADVWLAGFNLEPEVAEVQLVVDGRPAVLRWD